MTSTNLPVSTKFHVRGDTSKNYYPKPSDPFRDPDHSIHIHVDSRLPLKQQAHSPTLSSQFNATTAEYTRDSSRYNHSTSSTKGGHGESLSAGRHGRSRSLLSSSDSRNHSHRCAVPSHPNTTSRDLILLKPLPVYVPPTTKKSRYAPVDFQHPKQPFSRAEEPIKTEAKTSPEGTRSTAEESKTAIDQQARGKRRVKLQKYMIGCGLVYVNFMFIFATWWWPKYYYVYIPFISFPLVLNCIMIASVIFFTLKHKIIPEKSIMPAEPENLVLLMPCYNETLEECTKSLDSLVSQVDISKHKRAIMVICDGKVRGPGMTKTTADYLNEDIFVDKTHRFIIRGAYTSWDDQLMDVEVSKGFYKGLPFLCIAKQQNQGKRDSLIVIRSFLYNFNQRHTKAPTIFSATFFNTLSSFLLAEHITSVQSLIGMDADTYFAPHCISTLLSESRYPNTVGVCGYVVVDFTNRPFGLWSLYQSTEYTISQALRRLHQSIATHKVSCLPGCCQLLKICDQTCSDSILLQKFGYFPKHLDGMLPRIRATASEDRNHVCLMLTSCPEVQTRQALRAEAYTGVPQSWSVFLSQRRRWTLGATANDLLLVTARGTQWWERILAFSNVVTWCLNVFVLASIGAMIVAFMHQPYYIILAFAGVMIIPLIYYVLIVIWLPRTALARTQYIAGLGIFIFCGPFLNIAVLLFAVWNMDSFGWGKTRLVVEEDGDSEKGKKGNVI